MECPECQFEVSDESHFCNKCGCYLKSEIETVRPSRTAESERKHVTIMFSDLSGYTAMNEKLDPEEVKEIMSRIFGEITRIIKTYDGFIERFIGDAVMAVFGIPKAHEDDPVRAIRAAVEILEAVEGISPQFEERIGRSLTMHIGINTGLVVTGEVDVEKGTHGLTGDAINLASRLEGIAGPGEIVVGPETYNQSSSWFEFETLEPARVKGKAEPVPVYKVNSILDPCMITQCSYGVKANLIGRKAEMDIMMDALGNLKQRQGSIISIVGDAGTGKSRLMQEFRDQMEPDDVQWREGHAYAYTKNMAYYPLTNMLTHAFQIREEDNQNQIREKVETGVEALLWDKPEAKQYLGSLFSLSYPEIDEVSPEFWRNRLHESVQQIIEAIASRGPTVMLFEDLHWADVSFIDLLHLLLQNTRRPVLFLCVYRPSFNLLPDESSDSFALPHQRIDLKELSWSETSAMLQSLLNTSRLPDELRYFVKEKAEGNPFYLEEIINTLIETGALVSNNGGWRLTRSLEQSDIPTTVQGMLAARLDRLEIQAKRILQEASVIGRAFYHKVLTRITDLSTPVEGYLSGLERLDLIRTRTMEPDLEYIFKHALTQEVVYNGLLKKERRDIHQRIGEVMEELFTDRLEEFYETLAFHFSRSRSTAKAIDYLIKSGRKSLRRFSLDESHRYFQKAFNLIQEKWSGSFAEKEALADLLDRWGWLFYYRGSFIEFESLLRSLESIFQEVENSVQCGMYHVWLGMALWCNGKLDHGYERLLKARSMGEAMGSDKVVSYASTWLSYTLADMGRFKEGIAFGNEGYELARKIKSDHYLYFKSIYGIAYNNLWMGDTSGNKLVVSKLLDYGTRHSQIRSIVVANWAEGATYTAAGDWPAAIKIYQKAVDEAVDPFYRFASEMYLCLLYLLAGQMVELESVAYPMHRSASKAGNAFMKDLRVAFLAVSEMNKGNLSKGMKKLIALKSRVKDSGRWFEKIVIEYIIGKSYLEVLKGEEPVPLLTMLKNLGFILRHALFADRGAQKHLMNVIASGKEKGALGFVAQANLELGILHKIKKRNHLARVHLEEALRIFDETEAYVFLEKTRKELIEIS